MSKFKIGDRVIANSAANSVYFITKEGWKGEVTEIISDTKMRVRSLEGEDTYPVRQECFKRLSSINMSDYKKGQRLFLVGGLFGKFSVTESEKDLQEMLDDGDIEGGDKILEVTLHKEFKVVDTRLELKEVTLKATPAPRKRATKKAK